MADLVARALIIRDGKRQGFVYNSDIGLRRWRTSLAKLKAGQAQIYNVQAIGDSITEGRGAGTPQTGGFIGRMKTALNAKFGDVGQGYVPTYAGTFGTAQWTFTGAGWVDGIDGVGSTNLNKKTNANGNTATLNFNGTGITILAAKSSIGATFNASVDGGAATSFDTNAAAIDSPVAFSITGLVDGAHTLTVTCTAASTAKYLFLLGAYPIKGTAGVRVNMVGRSGAVVADSVGGFVQRVEIDYWSPTLTIIAMMANDSAFGTNLTSYKSNLQTLITNGLQYGDVLLLSTGLETNAGVNQVPYNQAICDLAMSNNVAYVDLFNRWKGDATYASSTLGLLADNVHPNDYGHQDIATAILSVIDEY